MKKHILVVSQYFYPEQFRINDIASEWVKRGHKVTVLTGIPNYPQGKPELVAMKYIIPVGHKLDWHHHVAMNHGVLVQGELTIIGLDGQTKTLHEGDVVVEMVDSVHYGENRGTKPIVLYMFYISQEGLPLSVPHPEMQMK